LKIIVNPSHEQLKHSSLDVVLTGTAIGKKSKGNNDYVIMVEMEGKEVEAEKFGLIFLLLGN